MFQHAFYGLFVLLSFVIHISVFISASPSTAGVAASYTLVKSYESYDASNFFDEFTFFTTRDPTNGHVQYVSRDVATANGLISTDNGLIYMGVDFKTFNPSLGRQSVRLTSRQTFTRGLFLTSIRHMPSQACGIWPAFWLVGPSWPTGGEIDIIEGVNHQLTNIATLHSSSTECDQRFHISTDTNGYGAGFNRNGGGVYATLWTKAGIEIWFFPKGNIPADVLHGHPEPTSWGRPTARFAGGGCDFEANFFEHQIVFDTTFCGDWAGNRDVYAKAGCAGSCERFVNENPGAFKDGFWEVEWVSVFQ